MKDATQHSPNLVMQNYYSLKILFGFLTNWKGKKLLKDFIHGGTTNWFDARQVVNAHVRASDIAEIAQGFYKALVNAKINDPEYVA